MEALFHLDPTLPKARAVEHAIREAISNGTLLQGARLPSTRELAAELGIARNTVVAAIDDLVAEGVLIAQERSGVFVARNAATPHTSRLADLEIRPEFDLRPERSEQGSFPTSRWLTATRRAAVADNPDTDGRGSVELRTQLAAYLGRARGVETTADCIVICSGFRAASTLLAATLASQGARSVAIEDPSLPAIDLSWRTAGFTVTDLPVDEHGAEISRLSDESDVVMLTPSHQFPLGGALAPTRRQLVVDWAVANDSYIVEDDYDGEFRFDRRPIAALQRSAPAHIIYAGSTSKTLTPELRLGWLALPRDLVRPVTQASETLTGGAPLLNQLALADLIRTGDYERHIRRQRREYARRCAYLQHALRNAGRASPGIPAGLHALIPVEQGHELEVSDGGVVFSKRIAVHMLSRYTRSHQQSPAIIAGFATPSQAQFEPAVNALIALLKSQE